jgi:hypothetical protein
MKKLFRGYFSDSIALIYKIRAIPFERKIKLFISMFFKATGSNYRGLEVPRTG